MKPALLIFLTIFFIFFIASTIIGGGIIFHALFQIPTWVGSILWTILMTAFIPTIVYLDQK